MNIIDEVILKLKLLKELDKKVYKYWPPNFHSLPVCSVTLISAPDKVWGDSKGQGLLEIRIQVNTWEKVNAKIEGLSNLIIEKMYELPYPIIQEMCMVDISDTNNEVRTIQEFLIKGGNI